MKDKSGGISTNELKTMFGGAKVQEDVWKQLVQEVDDDENGEIDYIEFKEMLIKLVHDE